MDLLLPFPLETGRLHLVSKGRFLLGHFLLDTKAIIFSPPSGNCVFLREFANNRLIYLGCCLPNSSHGSTAAPSQCPAETTSGEENIVTKLTSTKLHGPDPPTPGPAVKCVCTILQGDQPVHIQPDPNACPWASHPPSGFAPMILLAQIHWRCVCVCAGRTR